MARKRVIGVAQESHRRFAAQLPVLRSNTLLQKQKCVKLWGRDPVERSETLNHPLCGCALNVIQKNSPICYNKVVQVLSITKER